jgi:hypothetical protein
MEQKICVGCVTVTGAFVSQRPTTRQTSMLHISNPLVSYFLPVSTYRAVYILKYINNLSCTVFKVWNVCINSFTVFQIFLLFFILLFRPKCQLTMKTVPLEYVYTIPLLYQAREVLVTTGRSTINDHFFVRIFLLKCFSPFLKNNNVLKSLDNALSAYRLTFFRRRREASLIWGWKTVFYIWLFSLIP